MYIPPEVTVIDPSLIKGMLISLDKEHYEKIIIEKSNFYRIGKVKLEFKHENFKGIDKYDFLVRIEVSIDYITFWCSDLDFKAQNYCFPFQFINSLRDLLKNLQENQKNNLKKNAGKGMSIGIDYDFKYSNGPKEKFIFYFQQVFTDFLSLSVFKPKFYILLCSIETGFLYDVTLNNNYTYSFKSITNENDVFIMSFEELSFKFTIAHIDGYLNPIDYFFNKAYEHEKELEKWRNRNYDNDVDDYSSENSYWENLPQNE
jgi:hypothetical protein